MKNLSSASSTTNFKLNIGKDYHSISDQLIYQLKDIPIIEIPEVFIPEGNLNIHIPNQNPIIIDYNKKETSLKIKQRIYEKTGINFSNFYLVSDNGIIPDESTLETYFIRNNSHLLLLKKGLKNEMKFTERNFILKNREKRIKQSFSTLNIQNIYIKTKNKNSNIGTLYSIKK